MHLPPATQNDERTWQIWFDGSALPNPGRIGLGIVLVSPEGLRHEHAVATGLHGCNNEAELHALIAALDLAAQLGAHNLRLHGDSDVAISFVSGSASTQIAELCRLVDQAREQLGRFAHVELRWVPRHRNGDADRLCRQALGLVEKPPQRIRIRRK